MNMLPANMHPMKKAHIVEVIDALERQRLDLVKLKNQKDDNIEELFQENEFLRLHLSRKIM